MNSLSQELAKKIIDRLVAEDLITSEDANKLLPTLSEGKMRSEDWRLAVEKSSDRELQS